MELPDKSRSFQNGKTTGSHAILGEANNFQGGNRARKSHRKDEGNWDSGHRLSAGSSNTGRLSRLGLSSHPQPRGAP